MNLEFNSDFYHCDYTFLCLHFNSKNNTPASEEAKVHKVDKTKEVEREMKGRNEKTWKISLGRNERVGGSVNEILLY